MNYCGMGKIKVEGMGEVGMGGEGRGWGRWRRDGRGGDRGGEGRGSTGCCPLREVLSAILSTGEGVSLPHHTLTTQGVAPALTTHHSR